MLNTNVKQSSNAILSQDSIWHMIKADERKRGWRSLKFVYNYKMDIYIFLNEYSVLLLICSDTGKSLKKNEEKRKEEWVYRKKRLFVTIPKNGYQTLPLDCSS